MDEVALEERHKYETMWTKIAEYRTNSPADLLTPIFLSCFQDQIQKGDIVLDFGCGPGRSAPFLFKAGLKVHLVDITQEALDPEIFLSWMKSELRFTESCLWHLPPDLEPAEWMLCLDVLEHIPEEKIDHVLSEISSRTQKGGLFSIGLTEDQFGKTIGKKLHLNVQSAAWWKEKIGQFFRHSIERFNHEEVLVLQVTKGCK